MFILYHHFVVSFFNIISFIHSILYLYLYLNLNLLYYNYYTSINQLLCVCLFCFTKYYQFINANYDFFFNIYSNKYLLLLLFNLVYVRLKLYMYMYV